ncbi:MAG: SDR family oxidoreductase [Acidimicrobiia bacterium]
MVDVRTVAVSGSASGIGRATCELLVADGARVIGIDLRAADVVADLSNVDGRAVAIDGVNRSCGGRLDAVIACAGVTSDAALSVNYFGVVALLEGLRPLLAAAPVGRAVAIASLAAIHPVDEAVVNACLDADEAKANALSIDPSLRYSSSKAALCRWIRRNAASAEWAGAGIPLNAVAPGTIRTPMTAPYLGSAEAVAQLDAIVPMLLNGHAEPETVAKLMRWLVSEENTHVTGQIVFVDGGADVVLRGDTGW